MSYHQLLNPKGFAKEKSKKDRSNNAVQQQQKHADAGTTSLSATPRKWDLKASMNPKAAAGRSISTVSDVDEKDRIDNMNGNLSSGASDIDDGDTQPGMSAMLYRNFGVTDRETPPLRKRKIEKVEDVEDSDESSKKVKGTFAISGNGVLGDYMKEEQKKGAAAQGPSNEPIDLTNDDDDEDDVIFMGEKEVCLGRVFASAMVHRIPQMPKYQMGKVGNDHWPQVKVHHRRSPGQNKLIELFDQTSKGEMSRRFGSVDGKIATVLCPLMDSENFTKMRLKMYLEPAKKRAGEFPGFQTSRPFPISIVIYAPRSRADGIGRRLSQHQFFLQTPIAQVGHGVEIYNPQAPKELGVSKSRARKPQGSQPTYGVTRTQEEMLRETTTMFDDLIKAGSLPEQEPDTSLILTPLLPHQKSALSFLTEHERDGNDSDGNSSNFSLWKMRFKKNRKVWYNVISNHETERRPEPTRGGILADVMGLGKTLSILALIAGTVDEAEDFGDQEPPADSDDLQRNSKATLIICPKSVMTNWQEQIRAHTKAHAFNVYAYHGQSRTRDVDELAEYDIVLTTYNTAAAELGDSNRSRTVLASIKWFRIVLDEAHTIRNHTAGLSRACCVLSAQRRWALTGTPVQNRLDDLGALIKFLRIQPFDDIKAWQQHIIAPFRNANTDVLQHLRLLVASITLRRMKDGIGLTDRNESIQRLQFTDDEMAIYSQFARESGLKLKVMMRETGKLQGKAYAHVLKALGRLRSICAHGREMLNEEDMKELEGLTAGTAIDLGDEPDGELDSTFISERNAYDALNMMIETEVNVCTGCGRKIEPKELSDITDSEEDEDESPESSDAGADDDTIGYLNPCYHLFCTKCRDEYVAAAIPKLTEDHYHICSYCEQYVRFGLFELQHSTLKNILDSRANANKKGKAKWDESTYSGPHTKVKALLADLKKSEQETAQLPPEEAPIRSVVFSGWTSYLDLIEYALEENGIGHVRLDGTMSVKARSRVLSCFAHDPTITVLLVSIKAGGQGLNFTAANKVYMMEPQFNPGVEQQAIDRVHRLGQKRDVQIVHYIMQDSVEERILKLQEKKEKLAKLSLEGKVGKRAEEQKKRIEELRELFK